MSRLRIFVLLATVVALAGALTACGGGDSSDEGPQQILENATFNGARSGTIDLALRIASTGERSGAAKLSLTGSFQRGAAGSLPRLDLAVVAKGQIGGEDIDFNGGLTLLNDRAFINYKGTEYEVDPTTFGFFKSGFEEGQPQGSAEAADPTACQDALAAIDLATVVDNPKDEGSADVAGTSTMKVSGRLNPEGAADAILALGDDPACAAQLEATGALDELEATRGDLSGGLKRAPIEIYVGDDGIVRKVDTALVIEPKEQSGSKVAVDLSFTLGAVNEQQPISPPPSAEPLAELFKVLDINPLKLLEAGQSGGIGGLLEGLGGNSGDGLLGALDLDLGEIGDAAEESSDCLDEAKTTRDLQRCASTLGSR